MFDIFPEVLDNDKAVQFPASQQSTLELTSLQCSRLYLPYKRTTSIGFVKKLTTV